MNIIEIILSGIGGASVIEALLLLITVPEEILDPEMKKKIDDILKEVPSVRDSNDVRQMLRWILNDRFHIETHSDKDVLSLLTTLKELKGQMIKFYLERLKNIDDPTINLSCDVHSRLAQFSIQIMRLRMIIQPEIQLSINRHSETKIVYIACKGFWINDDGTKHRIFTRNIGRADEYTDGIKDENAKRIGISKLRSAMLEKYNEIYN